MDRLPEILAEQFWEMSIFEIVALVFAIAYLLLAIRQNIWCWICAGISTAIYIYLFAAAKLYMESLLNAFYFVMAIYGWTVWRRGSGDLAELPVAVWPGGIHLRAISVIVVLSSCTGYLLGRYTDAAYPYVDSMTTFSAVWATFLVARKILENWWYWLAIDLVSVYIYWLRDLQFTSLLFVFYVVLIPFGLVAWTRSYRGRQVTAAAA
jgi:nicotinamide mononucleotide transporter